MFTPNPKLLDRDAFNVARSVLSAAVSECAISMAKRMDLSGWRVADDSPYTYESLCAEFHKAMNGDQIYPVYGAGSSKTVYSHPAVNHAFRFWHDATHYWHGFDFSVPGEEQTGLFQLHYMSDVTGIDRGDATRLLYADTLGQVYYFDKFKRFVDNQRDFVQVYAATGDLDRAAEAAGS